MRKAVCEDPGRTMKKYSKTNCARWVFPRDLSKYKFSLDTLKALSIYVEPSDPSLALPDTIEFGNDGVRLWGQFYKTKGYPKGLNPPPKESDSARVFRYTKYEILNDKYHNF